MRRLGLDTEPKLVCLERQDAVRYRDLLQALVGAGDASVGLARRRMAAALSLFDHLQRRYLVPHNPFFKLRRPREPEAGSGTGRTGGWNGSCGPARRRACRRVGCPLADLDATASPAAGAAPARRTRCNAGVEPSQLRLW